MTLPHPHNNLAVLSSSKIFSFLPSELQPRLSTKCRKRPPTCRAMATKSLHLQGQTWQVSSFHRPFSWTLSNLLTQLYTFPSRLKYIVSSDCITDPLTPMRIGQITAFLPTTSPIGELTWIGITTLQIFSTHWRGFHSTPIFQDPTVVGKVAYEADVKMPVKED